MNAQLILLDIRQMLMSKRTSYTIAIMAIFALSFAMMVEFSPQGLQDALAASVPSGSAGVFEFIWFEDIMKFLLLAVVSFGAFIISDLDDDGTLDITLSRPEGRYSFLARRTISALVAFFLVFMAGTVVAGLIAIPIVGDLDFPVFIWHQILLMPMLIFVIAVTFFFSVPLRTVTYTVLSGFAVSLVLSFTHTFMAMDSPGAPPSIFNPMSYGYRVIAGQPLGEALAVLLVFTAVLFVAGAVWFGKKDV